MTYYDQISQGYEELHKEEQLKKVELIKKHLKLNKENKLLDVGCGTGEHLKYLSLGFRCTGLDINRRMIELARSKVPEAKFTS